MTKARGRASLDYTEMPQVNNSPIVESGSNSDGEWTRWADGTQICNATVNLTKSAISKINKNWTFPKSFSQNPHVLHNLTVDNYSATPSGENLCFPATVGLSSSGVELRHNRIVGTTDFADGDNADTKAHAVGRW